MAFNHVTIGTAASTFVVNRNFELEIATLAAIGVSMSREAGAFASHRVRVGLTPPGDENVQIYMTLINGILSPGDGLTWSGSIRLRTNTFLVLNYVANLPGFLTLTWATN